MKPPFKMNALEKISFLFNLLTGSKELVNAQLRCEARNYETQFDYRKHRT